MNEEIGETYLDQKYWFKQSAGMPNSELRFYRRALKFLLDGRPHPFVRHHYEWLRHNCIVHPLLGIWPSKYSVRLHDRSSAALNKSQLYYELMPQIKGRYWWVVHNCFAHFMIGVWPTRLTFRFHDWSAKKMRVPGWV